MPLRRVTRAVLALATTLAAAGALFGWLVNRPGNGPPSAPSTAEGAALFEVRCGGCHRVEDVAGYVRSAPTPEAGRRALVALLASHGEATDDEDAAIVTFVAESSR